MMRLARSSAEMPGIVVAALHRRPRRRPPPSRNFYNNYIAECRASAGRKLEKSILALPSKRPRRRKPGAPCGNRNALKGGRYTAEMKAQRVLVRAAIARLREARALAQLVLALNQMQAQTLDI